MFTFYLLVWSIGEYLGEDLGFGIVTEAGEIIKAQEQGWRGTGEHRLLSNKIFKYFNNWYTLTKVSPISKSKKEGRID